MQKLLRGAASTALLSFGVLFSGCHVPDGAVAGRTVRLTNEQLATLSAGMTPREVRDAIGPPWCELSHALSPNRITYRYVMQRAPRESVMAVPEGRNRSYVQKAHVVKQYRMADLEFVNGRTGWQLVAENSTPTPERPMHLFFAFLAAAFAASLPAQNLLSPTAWKHDGVTNFKVHASGAIHFSPFQLTRGKMNVWQDVTVPGPGTYYATLRGWGGGTGSFPYTLFVDNSPSDLHSSYRWAHASSIGDVTGSVCRVRLETGTSNFLGDAWDITIELTKVASPTPELFSAHGHMAIRSQAARFIAISPWRSAPIRVPSDSTEPLNSTHLRWCCLHASPSAVLTMKTFDMTHVTAGLSFWVQVVDDTAIGSAVQFRYLN